MYILCNLHLYVPAIYSWQLNKLKVHNVDHMKVIASFALDKDYSMLVSANFNKLVSIKTKIIKVITYIG